MEAVIERSIVKERLALIFLTALLVCLVTLCFLVVRPFLGPALVAALLAIGFHGPHIKVERYVHNRTLAASLSTILILCVTVLPLLVAGVTVGDEIAEHIRELKHESDEGGGLAPYLDRKLRLAASWLAPRLQVNEQELVDAVAARLTSAAEWAAKTFAIGVFTAGSWVVKVLLAGFILFFFLRDGPIIVETVIDLLPLEKATSGQFSSVISGTIRANFYGVLGVALVQGTLSGIGFAIAGIPSPFIWGLVAAFCSMLPIVGPALVWVPVTVYLVAIGSYGMAIFLAAWGALVIGIADNIIRPWLVGDQTDQHPVLIFFSMLGGTNAFGPLGLFLGPLIVSTTIAAVNVIRQGVSQGHSFRQQGLLTPSTTMQT